MAGAGLEGKRRGGGGGGGGERMEVVREIECNLQILRWVGLKRHPNTKLRS